jgi:hypothetical protein
VFIWDYFKKVSKDKQTTNRTKTCSKKSMHAEYYLPLWANNTQLADEQIS